MTPWLFEVKAEILRCPACEKKPACGWCSFRESRRGMQLAVTAPTWVTARAVAMRELGVQPYDLVCFELTNSEPVRVRGDVRHLRVEWRGNDMTAGGSPSGLRQVVTQVWPVPAPEPALRKRKAKRVGLHLNGTGKPLGRGLDALLPPKPREEP